MVDDEYETSHFMIDKCLAELHAIKKGIQIPETSRALKLTMHM